MRSREIESHSQVQRYPQYQKYREMTIDDLLLENRVIFLVGEINFRTASEVIMKILFLQSMKRDADIHLYINCFGGSVDDTLAIYDTMKYCSSPVATYCVGRAESGAALILAAGTKGKRFALPHSKIMIHQPWGGITGQAADIQIHCEEILKDKRILTEILAKCSGQAVEKVAEETERDRFMSAAEAKDYGLVDEILLDEKLPGDQLGGIKPPDAAAGTEGSGGDQTTHP